MWTTHLTPERCQIKRSFDLICKHRIIHLSKRLEKLLFAHVSDVFHDNIFFALYFVFVENEYLECSKNFPDEILELQQNFERQKRNIGEETQKQYLFIRLPECLREVDDIKAKLQGSKKYSGIRYARGKVEFPLQMIEDLF